MFLAQRKMASLFMESHSMDFSVWSILKIKACSKVYHSVKDLKTSLTQSWDQIPNPTQRTLTLTQEMLCAAAIASQTRFEAVVAQRGDYLSKSHF